MERGVLKTVRGTKVASTAVTSLKEVLCAWLMMGMEGMVPGLLVPKVWYLCYFSAMSTIFPFTNLYFRRLGLTEQQIGLLTAFRPWVSFPAGSFWSGLADKLRAHRAVLLMLFGMSTILRLSLAAASSFAVVMALTLSTEAFSSAITIVVDAAVMAACSKEGDYSRQRLFGAIGWGAFALIAGIIITHKGIYAAFVCHAALALLTAPPTALLPFGPLHAKLGRPQDMEPTGASGSKGDSKGSGGMGSGTQQESGNEPAWHEVALEVELPLAGAGQRGRAASLASASEGQIIAQHRVAVQPSGRAGLGASSGGSSNRGQLEAVGHTSSMPGEGDKDAVLECQPLLVEPGNGGSDSRSAKSKEGKQHGAASPSPSRKAGSSELPQASVQFWSSMGQLLRNPHALVFFGQVLTMGFGVGNIEGYLFLYLDSLGGSETLMGLSLTVTCAAETVVFWFSGYILRALGPKACVHLVFVAFLVRLLCYATLARWGSPWKVLPVELLHGFTFALAWGTGTAVASRVAPPGLEATTQGLFQGLYFGVGYGIGGLVGGAVYQYHGPQQVYWVAFAVMLCGWLLGGLAELLLGWCSTERETLQLQVLEVPLA